MNRFLPLALLNFVLTGLLFRRIYTRQHIISIIQAINGDAFFPTSTWSQYENLTIRPKDGYLRDIWDTNGWERFETFYFHFSPRE